MFLMQRLISRVFVKFVKSWYCTTAATTKIVSTVQRRTPTGQAHGPNGGSVDEGEEGPVGLLEVAAHDPGRQVLRRSVVLDRVRPALLPPAARLAGDGAVHDVYSGNQGGRRGK